MERVWEKVHRACGHSVERQVHVAQWDRFRWHCLGANCTQRGVSHVRPAGPCTACGASLSTAREEAVLDLEVQSAEVPRTYFDVAVRYAVPGDNQRLRAASDRDGAVAHEAEGDKRRRYPDGLTPWRCVPLVTETGGRHGRQALLHLRALARAQASHLEEGGLEAANALVARWGAWLSVALQRANHSVVSRAFGSKGAGARELASSLAG